MLKTFAGQTLITTDGTTLLGSDDKAGIAEILEAAEILLRGEIPHGKVCLGFTPDEEIGRGPLKFDVRALGRSWPIRWTAAPWAPSSMRTSTPTRRWSPSRAIRSIRAPPRAG